MAWLDWLKKLFGLEEEPRKPLLPERPLPQWPPTAQQGPPPIANREQFMRPAPQPVAVGPAAPPLVKSSLVLTGLELSDFAPLSNKEMRAELSQTGSLFGNPWFGRRDLIPPVTDKRTELIDRGMVGQELITPEE